MIQTQTPKPTTSAELRDFMIVVRNALLIIVRYIEKRYMTNERTQTQIVTVVTKTGTRSE